MKYDIFVTKKKENGDSLNVKIDLNSKSELTVNQLKTKIVERLGLSPNASVNEEKLLVNSTEKDASYIIIAKDKLEYSCIIK